MTALFGVATLTGCGAEQAMPAPSATSPTSSVDGSALPITSLQTTADEGSAVVEQATARLVTACMKRQGSTYNAALDSSSTTPGSEPALAWLGFTGDEARSAPTASATENPSALSGRDQQLLMGDDAHRMEVVTPNGMSVSRPGNGCLAEAEIALAGSADKRKALYSARVAVLDAGQAARNAAQSDASVRQSLTGWTSCMRAAGASYASPAAVVEAMPPDKTPQTWSVAATDVDCKKKSGLLGAAKAAQSRAEQAEVARNPGLVTAWKEGLAAEYAQAQKVLAGATG